MALRWCAEHFFMCCILARCGKSENILIFLYWSLIIISSHWLYNLINWKAGKANGQACSSPFFADLSVSLLMSSYGDRSRPEEREGEAALLYTHPLESAGEDSTDNYGDTTSVHWAPIICQTQGWVLSPHILPLSSHKTLSKWGVITTILYIRKQELRKRKWLAHGELVSDSGIWTQSV